MLFIRLLADIHMSLRYFILILFFTGISINVYSQFLSKTNGLTIYYGSIYRFDETYRHMISIEKWELNTSCTSGNYRGGGLNIEFTNNLNYNFGMRYFVSPLRRPSGLILYLGLEPKAYSINNYWGINVAPEIGLHISSLYNTFGFSVNIMYGYDIPIINKVDYTNNRHLLTLKIGLDIESLYLGKIFKKNDTQEERVGL